MKTELELIIMPSDPFPIRMRRGEGILGVYVDNRTLKQAQEENRLSKLLKSCWSLLVKSNKTL